MVVIKKFIKILLIVVFIVFMYHFVNHFNGFYKEFNSTDLKEEFNIIDINNITDDEIEIIRDRLFKTNLISAIAISIVFSIFETFLTVFVRFFFIWIIVIATLVGNKKILKTKYSKNDFNKYEGYWRDILNEYSVDILSFIDTFKIENNTLIAMLLQLENKNAINFNGEKIIKNNCDNLSITEKYIYDNIDDGKLKNISLYEYQNKVINEAISNGLLLNKLPSKKILIKDIIISIIVYILSNFLLFYTIGLFDNIKDGTLLIVLFVFLALLSIFISFFPIYKIFSIFMLAEKIKKKTFYRTKKGEEINKRLEGLKNYFKDFTSLSTKTKEEFVLWEEYLIYSVSFNQNKEIVEKYKNVI